MTTLAGHERKVLSTIGQSFTLLAFALAYRSTSTIHILFYQKELERRREGIVTSTLFAAESSQVPGSEIIYKCWSSFHKLKAFIGSWAEVFHTGSNNGTCCYSNSR